MLLPSLQRHGDGYSGLGMLYLNGLGVRKVIGREREAFTLLSCCKTNLLCSVPSSLCNGIGHNFSFYDCKRERE